MQEAARHSNVVPVLGVVVTRSVEQGQSWPVAFLAMHAAGTCLTPVIPRCVLHVMA